MTDKQEKELEMEAFETWEDPPYEIITPGSVEKTMEMRGSRERTPEEKEWLMKMAEILEEDMKRRGFRSNKEKEQNK